MSHHVLLEMFGLHEAGWGAGLDDKMIANKATAIGTRYVKSWQKGKGKDDPAVPGIVTDLGKLLKTVLPRVKKEKGIGNVDIHDLTQRRLQWLKRLKPERMTGTDYRELSHIIDDLKMWFG